MPRQLTGPVVIATHNPGKLKEMRDLLAPYGVTAQSAGELGLSEPDESGTSFAANARIKAMAAATATGRAAFADDSGLVVDALGGEPGIHSARWAGPQKDFAAAMKRIDDLLNARGAKNPAQRRAHFIAALCLAWPDGHVEEFEGRVDGVVVWPPRGEKGFGYDPLFLPDGSEAHLRRDGRGRKAWAAAARQRPVASRPRLREAGAGLLGLASGAVPRRYKFNQLSSAKVPSPWLFG